MSGTSDHPILSAAAAMGLVLTLSTPATGARPGASTGWLDTLSHQVAHFVGLDRLQAGAATAPVRPADGNPGAQCAYTKDPNGLCVQQVQ